MTKKSHLLSYALLVFSAFGWALSTIVIKATIGSVPAFHLMAGRFIFASLLLILVKPKVIKAFNWPLLKSSFFLALFLFLAYTFSIVSLNYTSASKSGFLVALSVLFVPIVQSVTHKKWPTLTLTGTIALSLAGMWLISGINGTGFNIGDLYAILCSVAYTGYIMAMHHATNDHPTYALSVMQLIMVAAMSIIGLFLFEDLSLPTFISGAFPILTIGLVGTALTTLAQTYAQQRVSPEAVGIILLGEPLFTLFMALVLLGETATFSGLIGGALLLAAMVLTVVKKL